MAGGYNLSQLDFLIVDDNQNMRSLVRTILNNLGVKNIHEASGAPEALDMMRQFRTDILILDWRMEPVDGIAFTKQLRTDPQSPNRFVPIVMLTAHSQKHRVNEARDAGVNEFVVKPVSARALYARIRSLIGTPREFVETATYFGPDRRRKAAAFEGPDRRVSAKSA
jgi:two-component system chemotaxis response regulator CheY